MVKERDTPGARSPATITSESGVCARITPTVAQTRTAARAFRVIRDILPVVGASAMGFEFRPAKREDVGLRIGLSGEQGLERRSPRCPAEGIAGDRKFAVIDTEAGRAKHYADQFLFDHGDLKPPFRPDARLQVMMR